MSKNIESLVDLIIEATQDRLVDWQVTPTAVVDEHTGEPLPSYEAKVDAHTIKLWVEDGHCITRLFLSRRIVKVSCQIHYMEIVSEDRREVFNTSNRVEERYWDWVLPIRVYNHVHELTQERVAKEPTIEQELARLLHS